MGHAILSVSVRPSTAGGRMERLHSSNSHWEQQQRSSYRARHLDLRDIPVIENGELKKGSKCGLSAPSSNKQLVEGGASPRMSSIHIRVRAAWSATDFTSMSSSYTFTYLQVAVTELLWRLQPLRQPVAMVWAKARGSMDEVRWYILRRSSSFSGPGECLPVRDWIRNVAVRIVQLVEHFCQGWFLARFPQQTGQQGKMDMNNSKQYHASE
ncbi:hypothetical protein U0070_019684, partial [Myodes glareolus]